MVAFFFVSFEPWVAIDGDRFAVTFAAFAVAIPRSGGGTDVIRIGNGIEYANRGSWRLLPFALVVIAMHVCDSESADVFRGTLRFIRGPALRRFRQNGEQFLVIDGVRHEDRFVLSLRNPERDGHNQCQHEKSSVCPRTNESR